MTDDFETFKYVFIYGIIPGVLGLVGWIMKQTFGRLSAIEKELPSKVDQEQLRVFLMDKIEPLHQDVQDLNHKIEKIYDYLLKK